MVAYFIVANEYLLPAPWEVAVSAGKLFAQGGFYLALLFTFLRILIAFLCSFALGGGLALAAAFLPRFRAFVAPIISFLRTVPTMAVILALLVWTTPLVAPVIVTSLVLFPVVYAQSLSAFDGVTADYARLFQSYGVSKRKRIAKAYLPLAAPTVLSQVGANLSMGLKVMVSAEVFSSTFQSLGGMMTEAQIYLDMPKLLALTVFAVVVGFLLEWLSSLIYQRVVRWRK